MDRDDAAKAPIARIVALYGEGLKTGDVESLKRAFDQHAIVSGYEGDVPYDVVHVVKLYEWVNQQAKQLRAHDRMQQSFTYKPYGLSIKSKVATVWVAERDYLVWDDKKRAFITFDYETSLQLLEVSGEWKIVSKLFNGVPVARVRTK